MTWYKNHAPLLGAALMTLLVFPITSGSKEISQPISPIDFEAKEPTIGAGESGPLDEADENQVPTADPTELSMTTGQVELITAKIGPVDATDRGSVMTSGGSSETYAGPTLYETRKLEMARAAIEASRVAGTLEVIPDETPGPSRTPEKILQEKLQRLLTQEPQTPNGGGPPDWVDLPSVQENGPPGLTPKENEKLDRIRQQGDPGVEGESR